MTPEKLLKACEKLTYNDRMRRMVELGQQATNDTSIRNTLSTLEQGDVYQRVLATQSCFGSRDAAQVLRALADPSRSVRSLALKLVRLVCNDDEIQTTLDAIPLAVKNGLISRLRHYRRQKAVDMYIETLAARRDASLKKLITYGSAEVVKRYLGQVIEHFDSICWRRLACVHPALAVEQLQARARATESLDQQLILQINTVLPILTHSNPALALTLVRAVTDTVPLTSLNLQRIAQKRPAEIADLLLKGDTQGHIRFGATAQKRLDTERLLALYTRHPETVDRDHFDTLSPEKRLALYNACARGWRDSEGILTYSIVAALPTTKRIHEGRRHLALPALTTRPLERLRYAAFLPWAEIRTTFDTPLRSPDADLRGATLHALIAAVRYNREHLRDALQLVLQRRNEQDPVRYQMLSALAQLPHGIWRNEHLADLAQIIRDALNASDLSQTSAHAMEQLVIHLLPLHPEWSTVQIPLIYQERGHVSIYQLDQHLSDTDTRRIAPALLPLLKTWQKREHEEQLVRLAQAFRLRLRVFNELCDTLESLLEHTRSEYVARNILNLFAQYKPERLAKCIPRMLKEDKSSVVLQPVYTYLHRYRQDLLTPFLGREAYKGRFSSGRTRIVLSLDTGFFRWTPTQQELFAQTLLEVANGKKRSTYELQHTISQLAALPAINPAYLIKFASDKRQLVRDSALIALGSMDAGQGIPTLLEALSDERARIAIYALRGALLTMPESEALNLLRNAPMKQVTVAKEVIRLIGDLSSEAAYHELLALDAQDLHRDVRVALLRAFWPHVEHSETWEVFTRAAQAPDPALAQGIVQIPTDGMSPVASRRLATLMATLLARPEPEVRMEVLQRCVYRPLTDSEHVLLPQLLKALDTNAHDECKIAAKALFSLYRGDTAELMGEVIQGLLNNRRALQISIEQFLVALEDNRRLLLPATRAILAALAQDRFTVSLRVEIIIAGLPWEEVAGEIVQLAGELHADALGRAEQAIVHVVSEEDADDDWYDFDDEVAPYKQAFARPDADLFAFENVLAGSDDERLRRLALAALVAQSRQADGWSDERVARLQVYREDPSPLVAEAALFTFAV